MNVLRRLPLSRLLLLIALVVGVGVGATAIASAVGSGPVPPEKPLAQAIHDSLAGPKVQGMSANVTFTNRLLEGVSLAANAGSGGPAASNPLLTGGKGRIWVSSDGRVRIELQAEKGDTQVVWDGHTVMAYDAATNTVYRWTPQAHEGSGTSAGHTDTGTPPSVAQIEESLTKLEKNVNVGGATPVNVGGQPAYTVRLSPKEGGSLFGGVELSFDAAHPIPLRAAVYSSTTPTPVIELAAEEVSYGPVEESVFKIEPPASAKVEELKASTAASGAASHTGHAHTHKGSGTNGLSTSGHGITSIAVLRTKAGKGGAIAGSGLPKVNINGTSATELKTALGTILTFERAGVRYVLAGSVEPAAVEAVAKGL